MWLNKKPLKNGMVAGFFSVTQCNKGKRDILYKLGPSDVTSLNSIEGVALVMKLWIIITQKKRVSKQVSAKWEK